MVLISMKELLKSTIDRNMSGVIILEGWLYLFRVRKDTTWTVA